MTKPTPTDTDGRPFDLRQDGFRAGQTHERRHVGKLCALSAVLGVVAGWWWLRW